MLTQNEQVDQEWQVERLEIKNNGEGEREELAYMLQTMGMSDTTAATAAREIHADPEVAALVHVTQELGLDPRDQPSPRVAAVSSFITFSVGALVPLIPYLLGADSLLLALLVGGVGLLLAGAITSLFTTQPAWRSATRQLTFGAFAAAATYAVGTLIGVAVPS